MTAHQLLIASLDWKAVLRRAGVKFSEQTTRAVNSLTEYLCAQVQVEEQDKEPMPEAGTPYTQDLDHAV